MNADPRCTCPHAERPLGVLYGVNMGRGIVRLSTTKGCPVHDACHGWTRAARSVRRADAPWSDPYCPIHAGRDCPYPSGRDRDDTCRREDPPTQPKETTMPDPRYLNPAARKAKMRSLGVEVAAIRKAEGRLTSEEARAHNESPADEPTPERDRTT